MKSIPDTKQEPDKKQARQEYCLSHVLCNGGTWPIVFCMFLYTCKARY